MTHVTLADVILRRVPLTAREAVTLTLAVAREWDRQRAVQGPGALPDVACIQLRDTGAVSFQDSAGSTSATNTLGSLLGRLLGTDETESSRHGAALGVMLKASGAAGTTEVPTVPDDSFRSVLARFAEADCARVVAAVVERTVNIPAEQMVAVTSRARGYAGPERRRQPRIVAELRLDIRELERELFALRSTPKPAPVPSAKSRRMAVASFAVAGAACVLALLMVLPAQRNPAPVATGDPKSALSAPVDVQLDSAATTEQRLAKPAAERTPVSARRVKPAHSRVSSTTPARAQARPTFAGGARSITWLRDAR
jgi:hypothetical protein